MQRWLVATLSTLLLLATLAANAQSQLVGFIALRMGGKIKTNGEILDYVIASKLTDAGKQQLFRQANNDFNRYKQLEREWAQERFDMGLKQVAYFELLKSHYLRSLGRNEARQYFNATENAWFDRVQDEETRVLKHLLDQRLGIVKSREQFGTWLKEQGYPHATTESGTDVYFRWYDAMKARFKIEMQMEEVQEYEIAMAVKKNYGRIDPSPTDIWNLNERSQELIDEHLVGKDLSQAELDQLSSQHPEILVMVKDIKRLSLATTKLSELEAFAPTQNSITNARNQLSNVLRTKGSEGILKYIDLAEQLRTKYQSSEQLITLAREALDRFMESSDFNDYVLGRLYKLAATFDNAQTAATLKAQIASQLNRAIEEASAFEKNDQVLEESVYASALAALPKGSESLNEASSLIAWVIKFEAKKIALRDHPVMHVERYEYRSGEAYDRLKNHIKLTRLQNGLKKFRDEDVRDMSWRIELMNGERYIMDNNVYRFLTGN